MCDVRACAHVCCMLGLTSSHASPSEDDDGGGGASGGPGGGLRGGGGRGRSGFGGGGGAISGGTGGNSAHTHTTHGCRQNATLCHRAVKTRLSVINKHSPQKLQDTAYSLGA